MIALEIIALVISLAVATMVGVRNANRDFQPSLRSHLELFLAGIPGGFTAMLLILPEQIEALYLASIIGILTGMSYSFSAPRQWRYQRKTKNQQDLLPPGQQ